MANGDARNFGPIVGLSEHLRESGSPVAFVTTTWVIALEVLNIQKTTRLVAIKFAVSGPASSEPTYRISAKRREDDTYRVVAPHDPTGQDLVDGKTDTFAFPIHLPKGADYRIEVNTTMAMSGSMVEVELLNTVEFNP